MSRASKITLGAMMATCAATIVGVYYLSESERNALQVGPLKDRERVQKRLNEKQKANQLDYEAQKELRKKLQESQPLTGVIQEGEKKSS